MYNVQIQLESGYLDIKEGTAFPLNFGVADIRDVSKRSGAFSKSIVLSGTKNNHELLGHYYDVNIQVGTFNINTLTKCSVIQNGIPILENATLQLISVNKKQNTSNFEASIEYEVLIKDDASDFFVKLDNSELTDLDFSDLDNVVSSANIVSSWTNTVADGYKYLIGFQNTDTYTLKEVKPAIYAKTYFDRIFAKQGFQYEWASLQVDRFDKLIIPFVGDVQRNLYNNYLVQATATPIVNTPFNTPFSANIVNYTELVDELSIFNPTTGIYTAPLTLSTGDVYTAQIDMNYKVELLKTNNAPAYLREAIVFGTVNNYTEMFISPKIEVTKNGVVINTIYSDSISVPLTLTSASITQIENRIKSLNVSIANVSATDTIRLKLGLDISVYSDMNSTPNGMVWATSPTGGLSTVSVNSQITMTSMSVSILPSSTTVVSGSTISMNAFVPAKIKQKDFIKSIFTMYNLYIEPNKDNPNILTIQTRDNFIDSGIEKDWTYKLAKDSEQIIQYLPELSAKKIQLTYKEDSDEANKKYFDTTREVFGMVEFTFDNEYVKGIDKKELIFSATPIIQTPFNAYVPSYTFAEPKVNLRILYDGGLKTCSQYNIYDYNVTGQIGLTSYPYVGHWDDPLQPSFDINFALCDFYYYNSFQITNNNLYNQYWRRTISQINTGKMLIAYFDLTELDIQSLKLNDKIRIDNSWWTINKVIDYSVNKKMLTKVELMSVDIDIDLTPFKTNNPIFTTPSENNGIFSAIATIVNNNINSIDSSATAIVMGSGNVIGSGIKGMFIGNDLTPTEDGIISPTMKSNFVEFGVVTLTNTPVFQDDIEAGRAGLTFGNVYANIDGQLHVKT